MTYASVYPLLTTRSLARPFTYTVEDGVGKGAVVQIRLGGARRRGVVVGLEDEPPPGVTVSAVERVVEELPPDLVELALWVADYYGSTPGRALGLVAPPRAKRRGKRKAPAALGSLPGEAAPSELTPSQRAALDRIAGRRRAVPALRRHGKRQDRGLPPGCGGRARARPGRDRPRPRDRADAAGDRPLSGPLRRRIALLHSGLTEAERRDERERIESGEARVVVGARSAVFAPVRDLGLVVVDEEHDASYKQESDPRYDARTVAAKRAALAGAVAVYGSATPRPESWATLERLELGGRIAGRCRREGRRPASRARLPALRAAARAARRDRRGRRQGDPPAQPPRRCARAPLQELRADAALPELRRRARAPPGRVAPLPPLRAPRAAPETCPACGSPELARIGAGTQRLEQELERHVPELERIRLDADAIGRPAALADALGRFAAAERAVLLGTQMVAKGHHFAGVALAAVVDADAGLGLPDFRAEERTFQLVTQLAGRSGRDAPGRVIVQTFQPDARAITYAARHDVAGFLAGELERRRELGYPPFSHLVRILVSGPHADGPLVALQELKDELDDDGVLGPAPVLRLRGRFRAQLVAKTDRPGALASRAGRLLAAATPAMRKAGLAAVVDVDPQDV